MRKRSRKPLMGKRAQGGTMQGPGIGPGNCCDNYTFNHGCSTHDTCGSDCKCHSAGNGSRKNRPPVQRQRGGGTRPKRSINKPRKQKSIRPLVTMTGCDDNQCNNDSHLGCEGGCGGSNICMACCDLYGSDYYMCSGSEATCTGAAEPGCWNGTDACSQEGSTCGPPTSTFNCTPSQTAEGWSIDPALGFCTPPAGYYDDMTNINWGDGGYDYDQWMEYQSDLRGYQVCDGNQIMDQCGVCGGDGSSCEETCGGNSTESCCDVVNTNLVCCRDYAQQWPYSHNCTNESNCCEDGSCSGGQIDVNPNQCRSACEQGNPQGCITNRRTGSKLQRGGRTRPRRMASGGAPRKKNVSPYQQIPGGGGCSNANCGGYVGGSQSCLWTGDGMCQGGVEFGGQGCYTGTCKVEGQDIHVNSEWACLSNGGMWTSGGYDPNGCHAGCNDAAVVSICGNTNANPSWYDTSTCAQNGITDCQYPFDSPEYCGADCECNIGNAGPGPHTQYVRGCWNGGFCYDMFYIYGLPFCSSDLMGTDLKCWCPDASGRGECGKCSDTGGFGGGRSGGRSGGGDKNIVPADAGVPNALTQGVTSHYVEINNQIFVYLEGPEISKYMKSNPDIRNYPGAIERFAGETIGGGGQVRRNTMRRGGRTKPAPKGRGRQMAHGGRGGRTSSCLKIGQGGCINIDCCPGLECSFDTTDPSTMEGVCIRPGMKALPHQTRQRGGRTKPAPKGRGRQMARGGIAKKQSGGVINPQPCPTGFSIAADGSCIPG